MKSLLIGSLALALTCGPALAQKDDDRDRGGRTEAIDQALKQRYGEDTAVEIVGTPNTYNGVRVYTARVRNKQGESEALVTEYGDLYLSGMPSNIKGTPEAVRNTRTLFKAAPANVEQYVTDGYYIDLQQGDQLYRLRYDALGRLREVVSPEAVEAFETTKLRKAEGDVAGKVQELAERRVPAGSKIKDVYVDPRHPGLYVAKYAGPQGKELLVNLDEQGNIYQTRTELAQDELPRPVRDAFARMFDSGKIKWAYRTQAHFYQFNQQTAGGETITFKVRPNGEIIDVSTAQADAEDQAAQAKFREEAKVGPQQDDRSNRAR